MESNAAFEIEMSEIRAEPVNEMVAIEVEEDSIAETVEGSNEKSRLIPPPKKNYWKTFKIAITHPAAGSFACCTGFLIGLLGAVIIIMNNVPAEELKPTAYCTLPDTQNFTNFNVTVQFIWLSSEVPPPGLFVELNLLGTYDDAVGTIFPFSNNVFSGAVEYPMSDHFDRAALLHHMLLHVRIDFFNSLKNRRMPWTKENILMYCDFEQNKKLYYSGPDGRIARYEE